MADNITAPASGALLATDDVGGVQYPRVKVTFGADGSAADASSANPLPVVEAGAPPRQAFAIAPSDTAAIAPLPRGVRANTVGTITFRCVDSTTDVTLNVQAGETLPYRIQYIRATGTTATGLVGLA